MAVYCLRTPLCRMPLGPFGEVVGTTGTLETLGEDAQNYKSKVVAPRNPKLVRTDEEVHKVSFCLLWCSCKDPVEECDAVALRLSLVACTLSYLSFTWC